MSLSNERIQWNRGSKKHVSFSSQGNGIMGRFMKYLGGDSIVYKNLTLEDENGENYTQLYNIAGTTTTDNDVNVNATYLQHGYEFLPKFAVVMWSNSVASIPAGWLLCDGRTVNVNGVNVTAPDLRGRFVLSYGQGPLDFANTTINATGGEQKHTLTITEIPAHTHGSNATGITGNGYGLAYSNGQNTASGGLDSSAGEPNLYTTPAALSIHYTGGTGSAADGSTNVNGATVPHNNMPPYYVLCYIMKGF